MDTPKSVPWFYITVDLSAKKWLREGGRALLDSYGYSVPYYDNKHLWMMPQSEFQQFEEAAETIPDNDLDPYWADEMWDWDEVQFILKDWGYR